MHPPNPFKQIIETIPVIGCAKIVSLEMAKAHKLKKIPVNILGKNTRPKRRNIERHTVEKILMPFLRQQVVLEKLGNTHKDSFDTGIVTFQKPGNEYSCTIALPEQWNIVQHCRIDLIHRLAKQRNMLLYMCLEGDKCFPLHQASLLAFIHQPPLAADICSMTRIDPVKLHQINREIGHPASIIKGMQTCKRIGKSFQGNIDI